MRLIANYRTNLRGLFFGLISLAFLWAILFSLQQQIDLKRGLAHRLEGYYPLPPGYIIRATALEYKVAVSDILWIQGIHLIGMADTGKKEIGESIRIYELFDRSTDLDDRFLEAYKVGGIVLSILFDRSDLSNALLKKGFQKFPTDWQLPFYIGFNYMYHLKDSLKAAQYIEHASKIEGRPASLPFLAATLYANGNDPQTAILFLKGVYLTTKDEKMREKIAERIAEIEKNLNLGKESGNN